MQSMSMIAWYVVVGRWYEFRLGHVSAPLYYGISSRDTVRHENMRILTRSSQIIINIMFMTRSCPRARPSLQDMLTYSDLWIVHGRAIGARPPVAYGPENTTDDKREAGRRSKRLWCAVACL